MEGVVPRAPGRLVPRPATSPSIPPSWGSPSTSPSTFKPSPAGGHSLWRPAWQSSFLPPPWAQGSVRCTCDPTGRDGAAHHPGRPDSWALNAFVFSLVSSLPLVVSVPVCTDSSRAPWSPTVRGAFAQTFRSDYQAPGLRPIRGGAACLAGPGRSPLADRQIAGEGGASTVGIAAMGILALIGVPALRPLAPSSATASRPRGDPAA